VALAPAPEPVVLSTGVAYWFTLSGTAGLLKDDGGVSGAEWLPPQDVAEMITHAPMT